MSRRASRVVLLLTGLAAAPAHAFCWDSAGQKHAIEPELLQAIAEVESGLSADAMNHNSNGTRDIGLMQINSIHLSHLQTQGITEQRLLDEPCLSVEVGASVLAGFVSVYGYNWTAVGAYNAGNAVDRQTARLRYARKVWKRYQTLIDRTPAGLQIRGAPADSDQTRVKSAEFDQEYPG